MTISIIYLPSCDVSLMQGSPAHTCPGPSRLGRFMALSPSRAQEERAWRVRSTSGSVIPGRAWALFIHCSCQTTSGSTCGRAGQDVTTFYEQSAEPTTPRPVETIFVVQADGTGVLMVQPPIQASSVRLGKGQKRTKQKEAVVTGLYTIPPYPRSPQEVVTLGGGPTCRRIP